jgi:hypothetical protein
MHASIHRRLVSSVLLLLVIPLITGFLTGCVSGAKVDRMVVGVPGSEVAGSGAAVNEKLRQAVAVGSVEGGSETYRLWVSQISNENFKEALSKSLKNSGIEAENPDQARYVLSASIRKVDQPWFGFDMTVDTVVSYILTDKASSTVLLNKEVGASHTADFTEALYGPSRLRLANEGSAKQNISKLISSLKDFDPDQVATPNF